MSGPPASATPCSLCAAYSTTTKLVSVVMQIPIRSLLYMFADSMACPSISTGSLGDLQLLGAGLAEEERYSCTKKFLMRALNTVTALYLEN